MKGFLHISVFVCLVLVAECASSASGNANPAPAAIGTMNPILFVTQVPTATTYNVATPIASHRTDPQSVPRGGDLWIRYPDGSLRNLTKEAGYGVDGAQDSTSAVAVRQPVVHWSGTKALFAMLVGSPTQQSQDTDYRWNLFEVTGFLQGQTVSIRKVPCQPVRYNNIAPAYGSDDQIIFISDKPHGNAAHLYPQLDEYESIETDTGLWKINSTTCTVHQIEHAPSGVTYPTVDSAGRVIFTKWDHLQRDQQADHDQFDGLTYGTFNYDSEEQLTPPATFSIAEYFPELRKAIYSLPINNGFDGVSIASDYPFSNFAFNQFFPWMINQDGTGEETVNHLGRHELGGSYTNKSYRNDPALSEIQFGVVNNGTNIISGDGGIFHIKEDPLMPGRFYGTQAQEFSTATAEQIVRFSAKVGRNPDKIRLKNLSVLEQSGRMRNPLPLSNGQLVVSQTDTADVITNDGTATAPEYNYNFRLCTITFVNGVAQPDTYLTEGIHKSIQYWDPDQRVSWEGNLWELDPVEVLVRPAPPKTQIPAVPAVEAGILATMGISQELLHNWLHSRNLALIVSRNVTARDRADKSQPFNLRVVGGNTQTIGSGTGPIYPISHLQFFQADQLRGYTTNRQLPQNGGTPKPGRRILAVPMHDTAAVQAMGAKLSKTIQGAVPIAADGSMASFVPAGRAMVWQLIDAAKTDASQAVVRERNWLTFRRGETRVCASCHGVNTQDQAGNPPPTNPPQALSALMKRWTKVVRNNCPAVGGTGSWSYAGVAMSACDEGRSYRIQTCQGGNGCCDGLPLTETVGCF